MLNPILRSRRALVVALVLLLLPSVAYAQAAITGVVRDTSGAVLPGVTVEASSDVLIEKVRTAPERPAAEHVAYRVQRWRPPAPS